MNKNKIARHLSEIHNLLALGDLQIVFKKLRRKAGWTDRCTVITIDHSRDILDTAVHECLHILHPIWSEKKIIRASRKIILGMEESQVKDLLYLVAIVALGPRSAESESP